MFNNDILNLQEVLNSGRVQRFHATPGIPKQEISSHCWRMITILLYINPEARKELILACMFHDSAELWTGDVPFHVKKFGNSKIKELLDREEELWEFEVGLPKFELTDEEKFLLKVCDCFEGMSHCEVSCRSGYREALPVWKAWEENVRNMARENEGTWLCKFNSRLVKVFQHFKKKRERYAGNI